MVVLELKLICLIGFQSSFLSFVTFDIILGGHICLIPLSSAEASLYRIIIRFWETFHLPLP